MEVLKTIHLRDLLRRRWTREIIFEPISGLPNGCAPTDLALIDADGNRCAHQCDNVELSEDGVSLKTAELTFLTDLEPLGTRTYQLVRDLNGAPPGTDLEIQTGDDRVRMATSRVAIELPLGDTTGTGPGEGVVVPPPVRSIVLEDGTTVGGSRFYGDTRIQRFRGCVAAKGPVFGETALRYEFADGSVLDLCARLVSGDSCVLWDMHVTGDAPDDGWDFLFDGVSGMTLHQVPWEFGHNTWGAEKGGAADVPVVEQPAGIVTNLTPWEDWWDDRTQTAWTIKTGAGDQAMRVEAFDPGVWVEPERPGTLASWEKVERKYLSLHRGEDGEHFLRHSLSAGRRRWFLGSATPRIGRGLDAQRREILEWPEDPALPRPLLYVRPSDLVRPRCGEAADDVQQRLTWSDRDMDAPYAYNASGKLANRADQKLLGAYLLTGSQRVVEQGRLVERLRRRLDRVEGRQNLDKMRYTPTVVGFFDVMMGSGLIPDHERRVFRAQMAHLAYLQASPANWSMERGYCSRNLNMSVAHNLNLGIIACAIPDHPMARTWFARAALMFRRFMQQYMGPAGEWPESVHYTHVSMNKCILFAIAARDAGFDDLLEEGQIKSVMTYLAWMHTPRDPRGKPYDGPIGNASDRFAGVRGLPPFGRAPITGKSFGLYGWLAQACHESDPAFSRMMQWLWGENGYRAFIPGNSMEMYTPLCLRPELPAEPPSWASAAFRGGALMRSAFTAETEGYALFEAGAEFTRSAEKGGLMAWFASGRPVASRFAGGYAERAEPMISRVSKAHQRGPGQPPDRWHDNACVENTDLSSLPCQERFSADVTIGGPGHPGQRFPPGFPDWPIPVREATDDTVCAWRRQALLVKDAAGRRPDYMVLRDQVAGDTPTEWKFWALSKVLVPASSATQRADLLNRAPGDVTTAPTALEGDRFTGLDASGLDLEFFIASPKNTPRQTVRYSRQYEDGHALSGFVESMDLLHLQLPTEGHYFVAVVPRSPGEPAPHFQALCDGRVIAIADAHGTDYVLLSGAHAQVAHGGIKFEGRSGSIQDRGEQTTLALGDAGGVRYRDFGLTADGPIMARFEPGRLYLHFGRVPHTPRVATIQTDQPWKISQAETDDLPADVQPVDGGLRVKVWRNTTTLQLKAGAPEKAQFD